MALPYLELEKNLSELANLENFITSQTLQPNEVIISELASLAISK